MASRWAAKFGARGWALLVGGVGMALPAAAQVQISIDTANRRQTIEGLGATATGTWDPSIVGLFLDPTYAAMLRDDLGISMVRLEIPPEVQAQIDPDPTVLDLARFDFSPMHAAGTLAANLNSGHPGAVKVIGTVWSPPGWMKTNGAPTDGGVLRPDRTAHFAKYCAGVSLGFPGVYGVPLFAISPQNEPAFKEPYNSCEYTPQQYGTMMAAVGAAFQQFGASTNVYGSEDVGTVPSRWLAYANSVAGNAGGLARVHAWAIHSYPWQNGQDASSPQAWADLRQSVQALGKPVWVSEISGEDPAWLGTTSNHKGALALAGEIQDALVAGEATAYVYWAISDPTPSQYALMSKRSPTKKYFAARQFFRAIRPGAVRVGTSAVQSGISASAFVDDPAGTLAIILINTATSEAPVHLSFASAVPVGPLAGTRTSASANGAALSPTAITANAADVTLPASSVTTFVAPLLAPCWANCDGSTTSPVLSIADFTCFLHKFVAGDPWANCDGSTAAPILNIEDFACFVTRYGAGCP